jgi:hypothetical protein
MSARFLSLDNYSYQVIQVRVVFHEKKQLIQPTTPHSPAFLVMQQKYFMHSSDFISWNIKKCIVRVAIR